MATSKKNFYVVVKGRKPGIYPRWTGPGGAQEQVDGYPGAVYRGFATREEADHFLRTGGQRPPAAPSLLPGSAPDSPAPARRVNAAADHLPDLAAGKVVIFTDGASTGNPGPGGYGVVLLTGSARTELSGGFRCTTNNRMEMMAVIAALESLSRSTPGASVVLYSDSRYVVDSIQKGWARRWRSRGWMRDATNRAENADLWQRLLDLLERTPVEFRWVRGHASHKENERCDRLAVAAAHGKNLPEDAGFTGRC
jgi:ribonuclease HI